MENFYKDQEAFCVYCGKEKQYEDSYQGYEHEYLGRHYYDCECEDSKKAREIEEKIKDLTYEIPKAKYKMTFGYKPIKIL